MVTIYGTPGCNYCVRAKELCDDEKIPYEYVDLFDEDTAVEDLTTIIGPFKTVPQIFIDGEYVGGYTEFHMHLHYNS